MTREDDDLEAPERGPYRLLCALGALVFLAVALAPVPSSAVVDAELKWRRTAQPESVIVIGNSVVDHVSRCDADRRTIPEMLHAMTGAPMLDLSRPGQAVDEGEGYALQSIRRGGNGPVVLLISLFGLDVPVTSDLWTQLFFRVAGGGLHATSVVERFEQGAFLKPQGMVQLTPYSYKGKSYPDYDTIKDTYFARERRLTRCPETLGKDRRFIESTYWNNYLRTSLRGDYVSDLAALAGSSSQAGKRPLMIVLLPIDVGDVAGLDPELASRIEQRRAQVVQALTARSVPFLDLSGAEQPDHFADRWCGCGHLRDAGRKDVSTRVAAAMAARGMARALQ